MKTDITTIDAYIAEFPKATRLLLNQMRETIRKAAPDAEEKISYAIPTFFLHRNLVHFAGYKNHIGFYPGTLAMSTFEKELSKYKKAKGSVQFPLDAPLPLSLITKMVKFGVKQNLAKAKK